MLNKGKIDVLDQLIDQLILDGVSPAISINLVTRNEHWKRCYGHRQLVSSCEENTLDTIFDLASLSKVVSTTTCILKCIEEGLLTLETKLCDVLESFDDKNVKIIDCMTHTSGLPVDIDGYKLMSTEQMHEACKHVMQDPEWIGKVRYSDVNFILLGKVIDSLKGSLEKYADEVIFKPLYMIETGYKPAEYLKSRCAAYEDIPSRGGVIKGVVHDGKAYKFGGVSGHAGLFSTINDLTNFVTMLIQDGIYNGKRFFKEETMELLKTCFADVNGRRTLGWIISDPSASMGKCFSEHTLYHTGFSGPSLLIDLDRGFGIILLTNRVHPSRDNMKILQARNTIHDACYACLEGESK